MAAKTDGIIVMDAKGKPFESAQKAGDYLRTNDYDLTKYFPYPNPDGSGFVGADLVRLKELDEAKKSGNGRKAVNPLDVAPFRKLTLQAVDQGDSEIFVGVNGVEMYFPVDEQVVVSDPFYQVLKTSRKTRFKREAGELRQTARPAMCYPTQDESPATLEEMRAFLEVYNKRRKAKTGTTIAAEQKAAA